MLAAVTHWGLIGQAVRVLLLEKMKANADRKGSPPRAWPGAGGERMLFGSNPLRTVRCREHGLRQSLPAGLL